MVRSRNACKAMKKAMFSIPISFLQIVLRLLQIQGHKANDAMINVSN